MAERHGVEIDYCPQCRGVWLDRGELDKIIEQAVVQDTATGVPPQMTGAPAPGRHPGGSYPAQPLPGPHAPPYDPYYYQRRKKWWHDMFDFD
jgi:hypothetical protein